MSVGKKAAECRILFLENYTSNKQMRNIGDNISDIRGAPLKNGSINKQKQLDGESHQARKIPERPYDMTLHIIQEDRKVNGQARKSAGWMPWHQEPKKDVTSCDKLWGGANIL